jgi:hypothetical protein
MVVDEIGDNIRGRILILVFGQPWPNLNSSSADGENSNDDHAKDGAERRRGTDGSKRGKRGNLSARMTVKRVLGQLRTGCGEEMERRIVERKEQLS